MFERIWGVYVMNMQGKGWLLQVGIRFHYFANWRFTAVTLIESWATVNKVRQSVAGQSLPRPPYRLPCTVCKNPSLALSWFLAVHDKRHHWVLFLIARCNEAWHVLKVVDTKAVLTINFSLASRCDLQCLLCTHWVASTSIYNHSARARIVVSSVTWRKFYCELARDTT